MRTVNIKGSEFKVEELYINKIKAPEAFVRQRLYGEIPKPNVYAVVIPEIIPEDFKLPTAQ
jgi:hypothetical protein